MPGERIFEHAPSEPKRQPSLKELLTFDNPNAAKYKELAGGEETNLIDAEYSGRLYGVFRPRYYYAADYTDEFIEEEGRKKGIEIAEEMKEERDRARALQKNIEFFKEKLLGAGCGFGRWKGDNIR